MFRFKVPDILPSLFPQLLWRVNAQQPDIYLTFDDGPHPYITDWVLQTLQIYNAKATFFCVGENVQRFPETYANILAAGHSSGNHTQNHLKGWVTTTETYISNINECSSLVKSRLFRPPYGRITPAQINALKKEFTIVMWDILTRDFEKNLDTEKALKTIIRKIKPGSLIVFHDSEKSEINLKLMLPQLLEHFSAKGYSFKCL